MQFRAIFLLELLLACLLFNTLVVCVEHHYSNYPYRNFIFVISFSNSQTYAQQDPPGRVVQGISIDDARRRLIGDVSIVLQP